MTSAKTPPAARQAPTGILFPPGPAGDRSTLAANRAAIIAALSAADPDAATALSTPPPGKTSPPSWRFAYAAGFETMFRASLRSPRNALQIADAAFEHLYANFQFVHPDSGHTLTLADAIAQPVSPDRRFHTAVVHGSAPAPTTRELVLPYNKKSLRGLALNDQLEAWTRRGTIEDSAASAIRAVSANPHWLDLSSSYFVLLGAGSAMGPIKTLLALGANVIAIDLNRPHIWDRLITMARNSPGTLIFPTACTHPDTADDNTLFETSGANLFTDTPRILQWLTDVQPAERLIVGSYAYLDGALHVQVSLAMDSIVRGLVASRPDTAVAYLHTPTDLHVVPPAARTMALKNYSRIRPGLLFDRILQLLSGGQYLKKNAPEQVTDEDGNQVFYTNSLASAQGPNYALAKRIQQWRAIICRERHNCTVSANVAPATFTASNMHVRTVGWALKGMWYFDSMEVFPQETTNVLMTALLIFDINDPSSSANPAMKLGNPFELNAHGAIHGGTFRCPYAFGSIGQVGAMAFFASSLKPFLLLAIVFALLSFVVKIEFINQ